ncbi:MAG TPA: VacJ family lipoprotein [Burkholderiales bacterium]|nr:VacJ family lipoprotein [Burkholderiales bacterium]
MKPRLAAVILGLSIAATLTGCATAPGSPDPYEPFNRKVYNFNEGLDKRVLQPAAKGYRATVPEFVRTSIGNVFSNVGDVRNVLNNTLQGKFATAYGDLGRILINSTIGVLGLFDIASEAGIEKHNEDFGQTLAVWGAPRGPYLVLPLLGSSNVRDGFGTAVDFATDPLSLVNPVGAQLAVQGTRVVDTRAGLLDAGNLLNTAALDNYLFVRDIYLQRRESLVRDGRMAADVEAAYRELRAGD